MSGQSRPQILRCAQDDTYCYGIAFAMDRARRVPRLADAQALLGEPDLVFVLSFKVDDLYHALSAATQTISPMNVSRLIRF